MQTSAKWIAGLLAAGAVALGVAGWSRPCLAQSTGELEPGMLMDRGWCAGVVPPIRTVDGRRVVVVSAPESDWIVKFGPFMNGAECSSALSEYSRGSLSDSDYEVFKAGRAVGVDENQILATYKRATRGAS